MIDPAESGEKPIHTNMLGDFLLFLKGMAMGAANVIPGVSGGTIAFITNIYEELIKSLKSFDMVSVRLLASFRFRSLARHVNLRFLLVLFSGVFLSILTLGRLLKYLFENFPVFVWSFFFGLILASVYFVGKYISRWNAGSLLSLILGAVIAIVIAYMNPANENPNFLYLILCGVIAMASMLLPGLSGSFVLILLGNYQLIFLEAVPDFNLRILIPVAVGSVIGFVLLSRLISYLLDNFRNSTIGLLTGFILGSLIIIWPWKNPVYLMDGAGELILKNGKPVVESYDWFRPDLLNSETWIAGIFILLGVVVVILIEGMAKLQKS
jgi:putative membrane protein